MQNLKKELQSFGKTLLYPISILSFMAIFLGLSAALQNPNITKFLPFLQGEGVQYFLGFIRKIAGIPFAQLPLLFAMAIPLGMVKRDKEVAVYSSVVAYVAMLVGMNFMLGLQGVTQTTTSVKYLTEVMNMSQEEAVLRNSSFTNMLGIYVYNMNVLGGMIAGLIGMAIHNKFRQIDLHPALSFYSGKRFVPIASALIMPFIGMGLVFVWPVINSGINVLGSVISSLDAIGVFLYGFIEKLINPTGLHHILNQAFRFTALGGIAEVAGETQVGALNIYFSQLENNLPFSRNATAYLAQGKILHMMFGVPAAVFAIYKCALPQHRDKVLKFFIPGVSAAILTGITEPIEFTFIFISPALWIVNAILAGLAFYVPVLFNAAIGNVQGGLIDWIVFGVLQGKQTMWYMFLVAGPVFFVIYYFAFAIIIKKTNVMTLGRSEKDFSEEEAKAETVSTDSKEVIGANPIALQLVEGLGGLDNIVQVDNCISRLRIEVKDSSLVKEDIIKQTKPNGVVVPDAHNVQIVYGGKVIKMRNLLDDYIYEIKGQ